MTCGHSCLYLKHGQMVCALCEVEDLRKARSRIMTRLKVACDRAYCDYVDAVRRDECKGESAKMETGVFGTAELSAHRNASIALGRHRALADVLKVMREGE